MSLFRPCIDLHQGQVKQIVGGTLRDDEQGPKENFVSTHDAAWYAAHYRKSHLHGGHVICLGPGNTEAALSALAAWPGGLQVGGGITAENAADWCEAGASHVIVTSALFDPMGTFLPDRLKALVQAVGAHRLVIDLSCRRTPQGWTVAMNRWQTLTNLNVDLPTLDRLADSCAEFLIHAADVEGLCSGIDQELVALLGAWAGRPITYAGGVASMQDVEIIEQLGGGKIDFTVGSSLDLFGGTGVRYTELLEWNQHHRSHAD